MLSVRTKRSSSKGFAGGLGSGSPNSILLDNVSSKPVFKQALMTPVKI